MIKQKVSIFYEKLLLKIYSISYFNRITHNKYWGNLFDFIKKNEFDSLEEAWENIFNKEFDYPQQISFIKNGQKLNKSFKDYLEIQKNYIINLFEPILRSNEIDLILDLGSGWSRNSFTIANNYKDIKVYSGEYSRGGRRVAEYLIDKYDVKNIKTFKFNWNNPISVLKIIKKLKPKSIIIFSNCSIEQIPILKKEFFEILLKSNLNFYAIHNEPVVWQLEKINKPFNENYNLNFIEILKDLEREKKITNLNFENQLFGHKDTLVGNNCVTITYKNFA